jgi:hypothetical protein
MLTLSLLSRLTLRAPLVAYAPEALRLRSACARSLHVFARRHSADYAKVKVEDGADAGDLKKAVIAELKMDVPPDSVRLLREVEGGGAPVALDSRRALAGQGVLEGSSVLVEILGSPTHMQQRQLARDQRLDNAVATLAALAGAAAKQQQLAQERQLARDQRLDNAVATLAALANNYFSFFHESDRRS